MAAENDTTSFSSNLDRIQLDVVRAHRVLRVVARLRSASVVTRVLRRRVEASRVIQAQEPVAFFHNIRSDEDFGESKAADARLVP